MSETQELILSQEEIERRIVALGHSEETTASLKTYFLPYVIKAREWMDQANSIVVADENDTKQMKAAGECRKAIKQIRVNLEKERKALKRESLQKGQAIDLIAGTIRELIEPIEETLRLKEEFREMFLERQKDELRDRRLAELAPYKIETIPHNLRLLPEEEYLNYFARVKFDFEEAIKKAAADEVIRLAELEKQKEIQRKKALASVRASEMMKSGYQYDGVDLGELTEDAFNSLLQTRKAEKEEKLRLSALRLSIDAWSRSYLEEINVMDEKGLLAIFEEINTIDPAKYEIHLEYFRDQRQTLNGMIDVRRVQLADLASVQQEKVELVVENIELKAQVAEIKIEEKDTTSPQPEIQVNEEGEPVEVEAPSKPAGPTPEQLASDKLKILTLAGMIAGVQMPEMETPLGKKAVSDTQNLIEKIRVFLIEKSKSIK